MRAFKKTRRGNPTPMFVPTTKEENILRNDFWLMHWFAVKVIEKDSKKKVNKMFYTFAAFPRSR